MLENVPLRDAKPAVIVCPDCRRHLMEVMDVRWAMTRLEFKYACSGCGAETTRAIAGDTPVFVSRASTHLRSLEIFNFSPDAGRAPRPRPAPSRTAFDRPNERRSG
jgi:DNA-directed RNA polymerase subunit RPC12/RpoP